MSHARKLKASDPELEVVRKVLAATWLQTAVQCPLDPGQALPPLSPRGLVRKPIFIIGILEEHMRGIYRLLCLLVLLPPTLCRCLYLLNHHTVPEISFLFAIWRLVLIM